MKIFWGLVFVMGMVQICAAEFAVQVGAYTDPANAAKTIERLQSEGYHAVSDVFSNQAGAKFQCVMAGPYSTRKEAQNVLAKLKLSGWTGFVRVYQPAVGEKPVPIPSEKITPAPPPTQPPPTPEPSAPKSEPPPLAPPPAVIETQPPPEMEKPSEEPAPIDLDALKAGNKRSPFSGFIQNEAAYTYSDPDHGSKFKTRLHLAAEGSLGEHVKYKVSGRFFYDAIFDINDFYPDEVRDDQRWEAMFHETYLDISAGDWDFRLGRQQIIWGEVIGLFFADVVSAKDLREFVLQDFDLIRIPQWATRAEYFKDDFHAEFIWIPYMTYDEIGVPGSDYYPIPPLPLAPFQVQFNDEHQPSDSFDHSAYGLRLSILKGGWDLSSFYYSSMDASPAFFRTVQTEPIPVVIFQPDHDRIHQIGVTASKDFASFIINGEATYTMDRWFSVSDLNDTDGVVQQDFLDYIIGFERPLPHDSRFNLQFFQRWFPSHNPNIFQEEFETGLSVYASTKMANEKLEPEALFIYSTTHKDYMTRLMLNWYPAQNWSLKFGTDILNGTEIGLFGRFDQTDRVYSEVRYSF